MVATHDGFRNNISFSRRRPDLSNLFVKKKKKEKRDCRRVDLNSEMNETNQNRILEFHVITIERSNWMDEWGESMECPRSCCVT